MQNPGGHFCHAGIAGHFAQLHLQLQATFLLMNLLADVPGDAQHAIELAVLINE